MALQTARDFQLGTDFSQFGRGVQQGQQIGAQFQQAQRQKQVAQQATQLGQFSQTALEGDQAALGQIAAIDPQKANQIQSFLASQSEADRAEGLRENDVLTRTALSALSIQDPVQRRAFLTQKREEFVLDKKDTSNIDRALAMDEAGLTQALTLQAQEGQTIADLAERQFPKARTVTGTASQSDFAKFEELQKTDPERAKIFGRQAGFIRETVQEKADIAIDKAAQKEVAKANIKRRQGFIDTGIEAADSASVVKRSIALLKEIKTGGFDNIAFKARQAFGIEGADEAELSANLGKSVLAQLKPIFGAAFTVGEGKELKRIEASFGKSTAGNIRLLNQTLKIIDRAARRGIAAAEDQGDTFAANEIRASLQSEIVEPVDLTQLSDDDLLKQLEAARGGQ